MLARYTAPKVGVNGFVSITAGGGHTCALTPAGVAYCWGANDSWQLGDSTTAPNRLTSTLVAGGHAFASITAGALHTCALTAAGAAYCWGNNRSGQLGDGTTTQRHVPTPVSGGISFSVVTTAGRSSETCGLSTSGFAYCWGGVPGGQTSVPTAVPGGMQFASLSAGDEGVCALTKQGVAYCWGNGDAELGIGTPDTTVILAPTAVEGGLKFTSIGAGFNATCGVVTGGAAYCWGVNETGEVGDGTTTTRWTPVAVQGGLVFASVASSGGPHACGLTQAGLAYCWGQDFYDELGNGSTTESNVPVAVSGALTFRSIASGAIHNCALTATGVAYCWGNNGQGELGTGTQAPSGVPAEVTMP